MPFSTLWAFETLFRRPENRGFFRAALNIRLKGAHLILPTAHGGAHVSHYSMHFHYHLAAKMEKQAYKDALPTVIERPSMRVPVYYWFKRVFARQLLARKSVADAGIWHIHDYAN